MKNIIIAIIVILGVLASGSLFVVKEGTRAIVIQFGKVQKDGESVTKVFEPGLYFKVPTFDWLILSNPCDFRILTMSPCEAQLSAVKIARNALIKSPCFCVVM